MVDKSKSSLPIFVKLCSDKASFEARTTTKLRLNMDEVKRKLEKSTGHEIVVYTPHIIIVRSRTAETTLSNDGRMLIKRVPNEAEATLVAREILQAILK